MSRLITANSGMYGIEVLTIKLEKTQALLVMPAEDQAVLPQNEREPFTLDVELPGIHPFGRRCIHCQATLSCISKTEDGMLEVGIAISKMRFIPVPQRATAAAISGYSSGGGRIQ
jgi:hypothetical protein